MLPGRIICTFSSLYFFPACVYCTPIRVASSPPLSRLAARADLDRAAHHAQEMWVSCQALKQAIRTGQLGAASWQQQLKPLRDEAAAIRQVAGESGPHSCGEGGRDRTDCCRELPRVWWAGWTVSVWTV